MFYSQYRQDEFLNKIVFPYKNKGCYIDIGAHDGIKFSNSYFFEKKGWGGVCFEPNPTVFEKLERNRNSFNYNVCVGDSESEVTFCQIEGYSEMLSGIKDFYDQKHNDRIKKEIEINGGSITEILVPVKQLTSIPELINRTIDFASIDTEGNELSILKSIDYEKINISSIVVENNYNDPNICNFLKTKGYTAIFRLGSDEIYLKSDLFSISIKVRILSWRIRNKLNSIIFNNK